MQQQIEMTVLTLNELEELANKVKLGELVLDPLNKGKMEEYIANRPRQVNVLMECRYGPQS